MLVKFRILVKKRKKQKRKTNSWRERRKEFGRIILHKDNFLLLSSYLNKLKKKEDNLQSFIKELIIKWKGFYIFILKSLFQKGLLGKVFIPFKFKNKYFWIELYNNSLLLFFFLTGMWRLMLIFKKKYYFLFFKNTI